MIPKAKVIVLAYKQVVEILFLAVINGDHADTKSDRAGVKGHPADGKNIPADKQINPAYKISIPADK